MTEQTCKDRIDQEYAGRMEDLRLLWAGYTNQECPRCDGTGEVEGETPVYRVKECDLCDGSGKLSEDVKDLGTLDEYGLSFDYVAPHTFGDQRRGYFRYQLSWGGPADEFRIYAEQVSAYRWSIDKIEYWFLDWFDGAHKVLTGEDFRFIEMLFNDFFGESANYVREEAMRDYEPQYDDDESDED